ncbi:class I SAM-dependent methyltransferase [Aquiflexum sp. LQ15W]|uniref:class I SAM-dependent methyltransferase n=1 Tax=Cognataquiflexum nitidum TaxID=2922272 RepID=UPI001F12CEA7|nr:class I SAM-dependent methyltransferase [Cognataquiflexum nitidum]MCH6200025.1 class I SAM-dependent methyltransferase [Cognataquiflexum nitidum]
MKRHFYPLLSYLHYWLVKEDQYALQSPFVFDVYNGLLGYIQQSKGKDLEIEEFRKTLLSSDQTCEVEDFGAGSIKLTKPKRKISSVTKYSTSSRKFSQLYQFFCSKTPALNVYELGTCVGINTRYLAQATKGTLFTFEGSQALWSQSQEIPKPENTHFVLGNLKNSLPYILDKNHPVDFALLDANHTFQATLEYFELILPKIKESSIIAIADIHWSKEMNRAWEKIKSYPEVVISLDFFECGILFFDKTLSKSHYTLHY